MEPFYGTVVESDGKVKLSLERREGFKAQLKALVGSEIELTLQKKRRRTSSRQHRFYRGPFMDAIMEETFGSLGTPDERESVHRALAARFLLVREEGLPDRIRSTSELTPAEMEEFNDRVRQYFAEEYGTRLPIPNEDEIEGWR